MPITLVLSWGGFLQSLRDLEKLLNRVYMREHFIATCVGNKSDSDLLGSWSASLRGLRWEAIQIFCAEVTREIYFEVIPNQVCFVTF